MFTAQIKASNRVLEVTDCMRLSPLLADLQESTKADMKRKDKMKVITTYSDDNCY